jgi:8-oxo-dGTP diphosphatase
MILRASALIDAPDGAVRQVLARTDIWTRTAKAVGGYADLCGERTGERAPLRTGDLIRFRSDRSKGFGLNALIPARSLILSTTVTAGLPRFELLAGPPTCCRISLTTASTGTGTLVTVEGQWEMRPRLFTSFYRRRILAAGQLLLGIVRLAAAETAVVVAGAIIENGRVLAARRTYPPVLAGKWELPGGKVRPGETDRVALARELFEELGVRAIIGERVGTDVAVDANLVLRCHRAQLGGALPTPKDHDQFRWLGAADLFSVEWLVSDQQILPHLEVLLT